MGMFDWLTNPIASIGSALIGGAFSSSGQSSANAANAEIAREQMAFQKQSVQDQMAFQREMSGTAYQRALTDMKAAGINPMLASSQGGASTPAGASAGGASAVMQNTKAGLAQALMNSAQVANLQAQTRKTNAEADVTEQTGIDQAKAQVSNLLSQSGLNLEMQGRVFAETEKIGAEIRNLNSTDQQIHALITNLAEQNKLLKAQGIESNARATMLTAQARLITAEARIQNFNIDAIIQTGGVGRLAREFKPASDIANDWVETFKFWKTKTKNTTGTIFDRQGNVSGGYSRSTTER